MTGLLLAPSEVNMNEQLGEILSQLIFAKYKKSINGCGEGVTPRDSCTDINCDCCPCSIRAIHNPDKYYVAQIGKTHHELRFSNSTGTDVQPKPRETSD